MNLSDAKLDTGTLTATLIVKTPKGKLVKIQKSPRSQFLKSVATQLAQSEKIAQRMSQSKEAALSDLHRFRVNLRKIQASTRVLARLDPDARVKDTLKVTKHLLKATGKIRDEEVISNALPHSEPYSDFVECLAERTKIRQKLEASLPLILKNRLPKDFASATREAIFAPLSSFKYKKLHHRSEAMIARDRKHLKTMASKLKKHQKDPIYLHQFRIQAKKLRYLMELLAPLLGSDTLKTKRLIEVNQDALGKLHDLDSARILMKPPSLVKKQMISQRATLIKKALKEGHRLEKLL